MGQTVFKWIQFVCCYSRCKTSHVGVWQDEKQACLPHHYTICWRCFLSFMLYFGFFFKNYVFISVWAYVWVFYPILLVHVSVFTSIPNCFYYYSSIIELKESSFIPPEAPLLCRIVWVIMVFFFIFSYEV